MATWLERERERERRKKATEFVSAKGVAEQLLIKGIKLPENFVEEFKRVSNENPLKTTDVSQLLRITKFWKPYINNEESYNQFVIEQVYILGKIHCIAINSNPCSEDFFIGKYAKLEGKPIMKDIVTTVMSSGGNASFIATPSKYKFE